MGLSELRGKGFTDPEAFWARSFRRSEENTELFGFDERARQIERNVGVR